MAGLPDPIGGIGYANVFKGHEAIDDWREDIKYARARKTKAEDEQKKIASKPTAFDLKGWEARDNAELTSLYQSLQNEALQLKQKGIEPFADPDFNTKVQKAKLLGQAAEEASARYAKAIDLLKTKGHMMEPDEKERYIKEIEEYASAKGKAGQPGGMYERTLMTEPEPPAMKKEFYPDWQKMKKGVIYNVQQNWNPDKSMTVQNKQVLDDTIEAEWSTYQLTDAYEEQLRRKMKQGLEAEEADKEMKQELVDALPPQYKEVFKMEPKWQSDLDFSWGSGAGGTNDYQISYNQYTPGGTQETGLAMAELPTTDAIEFTGEPPKRTISNVETITVTETDKDGNESKVNKTVDKIDGFTPLRIYEQDGKYVIEGEGIYEVKGVKKQADMSFVVESQNNRNLIQRNYLGGVTIEEAFKRLKGEQPTLEIDLEKKTVKPSAPKKDPLGIF